MVKMQEKWLSLIEKNLEKNPIIISDSSLDAHVKSETLGARTFFIWNAFQVLKALSEV